MSRPAAGRKILTDTLYILGFSFKTIQYSLRGSFLQVLGPLGIQLFEGSIQILNRAALPSVQGVHQLEITAGDILCAGDPVLRLGETMQEGLPQFALCPRIFPGMGQNPSAQPLRTGYPPPKAL